MDNEQVAVKCEPIDSPEDLEKDECPREIEKISFEPEFINIKTEIDGTVLNTRNDTEDSPTESDGGWNVPVVGSEVLPENIFNVVVKVEDKEHGDTSSDKPTTSKDAESDEADDTCQICQKKFSSIHSLQRHELLHSRTKYKCEICSKLFQKKDVLEKHMLKHTERNIQCDTCDKKFRSASTLLQHKRVHTAENAFFCEHCHRSFTGRSNLLKHQAKSRCKWPIDEPIQCHVCDKTFQKEFLLKSHMRRHDPAKPFTCEQCDMKFKYKSTLLRHTQLHEGIRPFSCPVCQKSFTHSGLLKPHMRVHTGEKPYTCSVCKKAFAHKHNMQRHALRHNKKKQLTCDVCHKDFPKESRLKYHMRIHVNEKFFSCYVCPKKFSHRQNVLRHYSRKHPNATYNCKDTDASVALKVWDAVIKSKYEENPEEILG